MALKVNLNSIKFNCMNKVGFNSSLYKNFEVHNSSIYKWIFPLVAHSLEPVGPLETFCDFL